MSLEMSLVFKLNSVDQLGNLHKALEQTLTLQERDRLEREIKTLARRRAELKVEIEALTMVREGMAPPTETEKKDSIKKILEEDDETVPEEDEESIVSFEVEVPQPYGQASENNNSLIEGDIEEATEEAENVEDHTAPER